VGDQVAKGDLVPARVVWDEPRERIVEPQTPFFLEREDGRRSHGLGHGRDAEARFERHRFTGLDIG
jgi:hypothetical protein